MSASLKLSPQERAARAFKYEVRRGERSAWAPYPACTDKARFERTRTTPRKGASQ